MEVSTAFKELSEFLERLESSDANVTHTAVDQDLSGPDTPVAADVTVDVPILTEVDDAVSIELTDATVEDDRVAVELSVAVSGESTDTVPAVEFPAADDADGQASASATVPAYKDPDALRAVYEQHDTFPEMTDALGVGVTAETVRRHMIKHDIHNPADATPQSYVDAAARGESVSDDADGADASAVSTSLDESKTAQADPEAESPPDGESDADAAVASQPAAKSETESTAQSAVTDGGSAATADTAGRVHRPVGNVLADASRGQAGGTPDAGVNLPEQLTVADLTEAINGSRTVHEVAGRIDLHRSTVRRLLQAADLIHFVSSPLAADRMTVSPDEVVRRLTGAE